MSVSLIISLLLNIIHAQIVCEEGYTCFEDPNNDIVWVKKDAGNVNGPTCQRVCEAALINTVGIYHTCDRTRPVIHDKDSFEYIATGLNFTCNKGGGCWDLISPFKGLVSVTK